MFLSRKVRTFAGAVAITAGGMLAFGTGTASAASTGTLDQVKKADLLTVGMLVDFPPYGILDSDNKPSGYDADVAKLLAKDLGVKLKIVPVKGPNRIPYLLTGKVDVLVASLAVTPARAKQVQFSKPYSAAQIVLFAKKGDKIKSAKDLSGLRIGVARASTQDVAVTKIAPKDANIRRFDDDASAMQALMSGQVDAIGCSTTVAAQIAKRQPDKYSIKFVLKQQEMAVAMRKNQPKMLEAVNAFIEKDTKNGELSKLYQKWLGTPLPDLSASK